MKIKSLVRVICTSMVAMSMLLSAGKSYAYDVIIIIDITGSTGDLLPNWKDEMKSKVILPIKEANSAARFALVTHLDFPFSPYGAVGEYAFRLEAPLHVNTEYLEYKLGELSSGGGKDSKESQYEAVYQSLTGQGRDLNGNGSYADTGDIWPSVMGIDVDTETVVFHFTKPLVFHNDPFEPNYPYVGVVNNPASESDVLAAFLDIGEDLSYWSFVPTPLWSLSGVFYDKQSGEFLNYSSFMEAGDPATRLAHATGGDVLSVGEDLEGLKEAVKEVIRRTDPCPPGYKLVELPWRFICVPYKYDH